MKIYHQISMFVMLLQILKEDMVQCLNEVTIEEVYKKKWFQGHTKELKNTFEPLTSLQDDNLGIIKVNNEETIYVQKNELKNEQDIQNNVVISNMQNYESLTTQNLKTYIDENGDIIYEQKPYIPNGERLNNLSGSFHFCLKQKKLLKVLIEKKYYITNYYPSMANFIVPFTHSSLKKKKISPGVYFSSICLFFQRIVETLSYLHDQEFFDQDFERISTQSDQFVIKNISLKDIGVRDIEDQSMGFPIGYAVIRDPFNIYKNLDIDHLKNLAQRFNIGIKDSYTLNEQKNLNYIQVFNLFLETLEILGLQFNSIFGQMYNKQKYTFNLIECFDDRKKYQIFQPNNCPIFMLEALNILSEKGFIMFHKVFVRREINQDYKIIQKTLIQYFEYLSQWGKGITPRKSYIPDPFYEIMSPKEDLKIEDDPGFFGMIWKAISSFFSGIWNFFFSNSQEEQDTKPEAEDEKL